MTDIFVTHGHGDHWFAAGLLAERFGARIVAFSQLLVLFVPALLLVLEAAAIIALVLIAVVALAALVRRRR